MHKILSGVICVVMAFSFTLSPVKASATTSSNEAQIKVLLQLIALLQAQLNALLKDQNISITSSGEPSITLTSPKNAVFRKNEDNDDVVIKWTAKNVPENTNVIYEVTAVESYSGAFVTGSKGQLKAKSGSYEHRIAIDIPGTLDPGEYKVRLLLEECHSLGCNVSYTFGPLKEDLKVYSRSNYGYFKILDSDTASVNLIAAGNSGDEIEADITDQLEFLYYPSGDIDECRITGEYTGGEQRIDHSWPNTILLGQAGRAYFSVVSVYPKILLTEVRVDCKDEDGKTVASDSIQVNVDNEREGDYEIQVNGRTEESGSGISEAEAHSRCLKEFNESSGIRVECSWDGYEFFDDTNWKG